MDNFDGQLSQRAATVLPMLGRMDLELAILSESRNREASVIGEYDGFGIVGEHSTFRGPASSSYVISARLEDARTVVLPVQRFDRPWRRELLIAPDDSWKESTNGGPVEQNSAHFPSEQQAIIHRLFDDIRQTPS